jgi:hypothetical protein
MLLVDDARARNIVFPMGRMRPLSRSFILLGYLVCYGYPFHALDGGEPYYLQAVIACTRWHLDYRSTRLCFSPFFAFLRSQRTARRGDNMTQLKCIVIPTRIHTVFVCL